MRKIKKRLIERYQLLKKHPVTCGKELQGLWRYIKFHLLSSISGELKYDWINGLKFYARRGDAGIVGNIYYGLYEFNESMFLLHLLRPKDVFLDIGANLGHYSLLTSGLCLNKSIAVEPVSKTYNQLKRQVRLNKLEHLITSKQIGIAEKSGELWVSTDRGTMDRIVEAGHQKAEPVDVLSIDAILEEENPLAIKIDVEGYEWFALQGAKKSLDNKQLKIVILELNNSSKAYNISDDDVYKLILRYGFKPYKYNAVQRELIRLKDYNHKQFNTIFVRDESFVESRLKEARSINIKGRIF